METRFKRLYVLTMFLVVAGFIATIGVVPGCDSTAPVNGSAFAGRIAADKELVNIFFGWIPVANGMLFAGILVIVILALLILADEGLLPLQMYFREVAHYHRTRERHIELLAALEVVDRDIKVQALRSVIPPRASRLRLRGRQIHPLDGIDGWDLGNLDLALRSHLLMTEGELARRKVVPFIPSLSSRILQFFRIAPHDLDSFLPPPIHISA